MGLTRLQKVYFWAGALLPLPSVFLYVVLPSGTIEYFGGTPTPTAVFWCTIAASGDIMFSTLCWSVLRHPDDLVLRSTVLWANALYSCCHFGGFLRAHYMFEPHPGGPWLYAFSIVFAWAAYIAWGRTAIDREKPSEDSYATVKGGSEVRG